MVAVASSVWRLWKKTGVDNIGLLVKTNATDSMALVQRACDDLQAANAADEWPNGYITAQPTLKGPGLFVNNCDDLAPLLDQLGVAMAAVGLDDATITVLPTAPFIFRGRESGGVPSHFIRARLSVRATPSVDTSRGWTKLGWTIEPEVLEEVLSWLFDFCLAVPGGARGIKVDAAGREIFVPREAVLDLLAAQARSTGEDSVTLGVETNGSAAAFRVLGVDIASAQVAVSAGVDSDEGYDWRQNLAEMTELVQAAPDFIMAAVLSRGSNSSGTHLLCLHPDAALEIPVGRFPSALEPQRFIEVIQPLDAYGFMLLPPDCAGPLPADPQWEVIQHDGKTLLRARDAEAWFAHDTLDPGILARARESLGDLIAWNHLDPRVTSVLPDWPRPARPDDGGHNGST